ncbi:MAG TPA: cobalamin-binding protein [Candidatus Acidoferrum sp.]|nr:cobalamin-binding protein [Candidatus Acidoferrum sp.]
MRLCGRSTCAVLLVAALLVLTAAPAGALTVVDMLGREVKLAGPPRRIVSLVPSATELIYALGGEDRLVGRTDFCDYPPAAKDKPSVGGMVSPSLETIATLKPDLVIATTSGNRLETFTRLEQLGIAVYAVHAQRIAEMLDVTRRLAELTGRQAALGPLISGLESRLFAVANAVRPYPRPRVLYVLWPEPLLVPASRALLTELIGLAGGDSITANERGDYPRFSIEAAVARAPEVILLASHSGSGAPPIAKDKWERLVSLPAVKNKRVHAIDGNLAHRYGPRVVDGVETLARAIHPEAFR